MRQRGRVKGNKFGVMVRFNAETLQRIDELCKKEDKSRGEIIADGIRYLLKYISEREQACFGKKKCLDKKNKV